MLQIVSIFKSIIQTTRNSKDLMTNIPYVKKKIGDLYLVWLQNSNLYFQLEEPAWFVFKRLTQNSKVEIVAEQFRTQYEIGNEESLEFVNAMHNRINEMNVPYESLAQMEPWIEKVTKLKFEPYSAYRYQLASNVIYFTYETNWLERYIHPLITHLSTLNTSEKEISFELFTYKDQVVFRLNNQVKGIWDRDESNLTKGQIFIDLINLLHQKEEDDWLMTVHASAITNGLKTILFSAPSGSGKTTMAALLQTQGYHLISDDFVPFDKHSQNAYPFPIAMSIKEGSMDLLTRHYPSLEEGQLHYISSEKKVRYLPIENKKMKMIFPVKEIIFVKYDQSINFKLEKIEPLEAFKLLLEQIWVPPSPDNVEILFEKIFQFSYYQLTYSDNSKALQAIKQLFENEQH